MFDPTNIANADALDRFVVSGVALPGLVSFVTPAGTPRKWDVRNGPGLSGATIVFVGLDIAKFTTRHELWLPAHFAAWDTCAPLVDPPPQGQRAPIRVVYHPLLAFVRIDKCGVEDVIMPQPPGDGSWFIDIKWIGYRKPLPAIGTGTGAAATQYQNTSANDAADAQINALLKQFGELNK